MKPNIIGVDPGLNGGVAIWDPVNDCLRTFVIPTEKGHDGKNHIDLFRLARLLTFFSDKVEFAVVEEPASMPGQGVVSMFRFGHACGIIEGMLAALGIKTLLVKPSVWKGAMGLSRSKDLSRHRAAAVFSRWADQFAAKKSDGVAEAALLAKYGERFYRYGKSETKCNSE